MELRKDFHSDDDHRLGGRGGEGIVTRGAAGVGVLLRYGFDGRDGGFEVGDVR